MIWELARIMLLAHGLVVGGFADKKTAMCHATSAVMHETEHGPAEVLLAIVWGESRFDPAATAKGHPYVCGVMQTAMSGPRSCKRVRDIDESYEEGANRLEEYWESKTCQRKGSKRMRCALLVYAGGPKHAKSKSTHPQVIMRRAWRIAHPAIGKSDS